jgi:hypothetical protein
MTETETGFIEKMKEVYQLYIDHGSRSNKNVNLFHEYIKSELEKIFPRVELEYKVKSYNAAGKKVCDIVVLKNDLPYIVFPVKLIKTNYKQNKNNALENLTGELVLLKWANPDIMIIPINIFMGKTPYLDNTKTITKFENITQNDISIYNTLVDRGIAYDMINYILDVEHTSVVKEKFTKLPTILKCNETTPYRSLSTILKQLV